MLNVPPSCTMNDSPNGRRSYSKSSCNNSGLTAFRFQGDYSQNLFLSEFGHPATFTPWRSKSFFGQHVLRVIRIGSEKQMRRVAARRIIALVQAALRFWYRSVFEYPRCSVRINPLPIAASPNTTITILRSGSHPDPAAFIVSKNKHLLKKAFWKVGRQVLRGEVILGNVDHSSNSAPFGLLDRRGISVKG